MEDMPFSFLDLYRDLEQLRETIVQEHVRLSALQSLLRTDGNKVELTALV